MIPGRDMNAGEEQEEERHGWLDSAFQVPINHRELWGMIAVLSSSIMMSQKGCIMDGEKT
jgi:hypothetical protein